MVKRPKRPRDPNQLGKLIIDISVGEAKDQGPPEDTAAIAFARLGGLKGGAARAARLVSMNENPSQKMPRKRGGGEIHD
jgi:hypothetical protein